MMAKLLFLSHADAELVNSRFEEAKAAFNKVVCIDPRHGQGLACLGMVHHVLGELDGAILRYHEVSGDQASTKLIFEFSLQALSVDPLDTNIIDLLNLALETNLDMNPLELGSTGLKDQNKWEAMMLRRKAGQDAKNGDVVATGRDDEFDSSIMAEVSIMDVSEDE
jgi:anaphase-promoting complex subunit 6